MKNNDTRKTRKKENATQVGLVEPRCPRWVSAQLEARIAGTLRAQSVTIPNHIAARNQTMNAFMKCSYSVFCGQLVQSLTMGADLVERDAHPRASARRCVARRTVLLADQCSPSRQGLIYRVGIFGRADVLHPGLELLECDNG